MSLAQLLLLALVQGVTEWLPISSSAHLILLPGVLGQKDQGPLIDAMAHLGTLFAMLAYFRRDVLAALRGSLALVGLTGAAAGGRQGPDARLALLILAATPPGVLAGLALTAAPETVMAGLRSPETIALATIVFGLALWIADVRGSVSRTQPDMRLSDAVAIGLAQMIAFIPGTSRSGITMTAARALGFNRPDSARFAMLIGAPLLAAVGARAFLGLAAGEAPGASLTDGLLVAALSFASGYASIWALMALLQRMSFLPFVIYRLALGTILLVTSPTVLALFT